VGDQSDQRSHLTLVDLLRARDRDPWYLPRPNSVFWRFAKCGNRGGVRSLCSGQASRQLAVNFQHVYIFTLEFTNIHVGTAPHHIRRTQSQSGCAAPMAGCSFLEIVTACRLQLENRILPIRSDPADVAIQGGPVHKASSTGFAPHVSMWVDLPVPSGSPEPSQRRFVVENPAKDRQSWVQGSNVNSAKSQPQRKRLCKRSVKGTARPLSCRNANTRHT